ncbi:peptidylprolyl isomerase [Chitinimonas koreensis]|uniref:peptidylprolyl isomerase n=1 Tax=Chitinimonas koreensis TaxID=356302 RepID=UPI00223F04B3|nr:peptidylprolyl isomerase [Chitinimonas koreensis]
MVNQKQQRAAEAARQLAAGKPFAEVAAAYSDAADALQGGDLGWRTAGRLPPMFLEALDQLGPGQTTSIMRSPAGFHIVKLAEKRQRDGKEVIRQTHARHILVKVNELTSDTDAKARIQEIRDRLINGGLKFEEQAKLHSEDGSAQKGGDLDWISPGDTVPEFEQAMNGLNPGDLSEPVRTPFGWHLIQVIERRDQDVTRERERVRVRMELRDRKADDQYEDWVRQQRDTAFVEIRLEEK